MRIVYILGDSTFIFQLFWFTYSKIFTQLMHLYTLRFLIFLSFHFFSISFFFHFENLTLVLIKKLILTNSAFWPEFEGFGVPNVGSFTQIYHWIFISGIMIIIQHEIRGLIEKSSRLCINIANTENIRTSTTLHSKYKKFKFYCLPNLLQFDDKKYLDEGYIREVRTEFQFYWLTAIDWLTNWK